MDFGQITPHDQSIQVQDLLAVCGSSVVVRVIDIICKNRQVLTLEFKSWKSSPLEIQGIARDIGRQTIELEDSERRYNSLASSCHSLICTHDLDGVLLSVNETAARALGYQVDEMVGHSLSEFLSPYVKNRFGDYLGSIIANREHAGVLRAIKRNGEELVWFCYNILCEKEGKAPFVLGHAQDVTDLVKKDEDRDMLIAKLQKALRRVKSLTGILPICSSCKSIRDDKGDWTKIEKFFSDNSDVEFSHAICPDCTRRLYPSIYDEMYP